MSENTKIALFFTGVVLLFALFFSFERDSEIAGYNRGYAVAAEELYEQFYNEGYEKGLEQGTFSGFNEGYDLGYSDGKKEGYDIGWDDAINSAE